MAITIDTQVTNGVSMGHRRVVTAADAADGTLLFDFGTDYYLVASVIVTDTNGAVQSVDGMVITYPEEGQVQVAEGGSFTFSATDIVHVVAQRDSSRED